MIYENIKKLCAEKKINIAKLEKENDLSNGTIGKWRSANPTIDNLNKIANYLNVPLYKLFITEQNNGSINTGNIIYGNQNTATINANHKDEFEEKLLNIYRNLNLKEKNELLTKAFEIENKGK